MPLERLSKVTTTVVSGGLGVFYKKILIKLETKKMQHQPHVSYSLNILFLVLQLPNLNCYYY